MKKLFFILSFGALLLQTANSRTIQVPQDCSEYGGASTNIIDGHEYVDLGLPSGTLWATCNVGADSPEEYGDYFAWGETAPKNSYNWSTYKYGTSAFALTKYCDRSTCGLNRFTDNKMVLDAEDDAATANWGDEWRMPTLDEIRELSKKCSIVWTTQNGVKGRLFTGPNGNTLFLPVAGVYYQASLDDAGSIGQYWSSTLHGGNPGEAYSLCLASGSTGASYYSRCLGYSVRPVVK